MTKSIKQLKQDYLDADAKAMACALNSWDAADAKAWDAAEAALDACLKKLKELENEDT